MADELLATGGLPSDAPAPYDRVAEVLASAAGPPSDRELAPAAAFGTRLAAVARRHEPISRGMGMASMFRSVRAKVPNVAVGVMVGLLFGGSAYAVGEATSGIHGGPKPRYHDAKVCDLVDVKKLPGNWTHGDYVSAVEKKDPSKVQEAAHSQCGKPNHAGGRGPKDKQKGAKPEEKPGAPRSPKPSTPAATKKPSASPSPSASASPTQSSSPTPTPTGSTGAVATPST